MVHWAGQTNWWQTNDKGHSGLGEVLGGVILLLSWELLTLRGWFWTRYYQKCPVAWGKFNEFLPVLTSCSSSITSRGWVCNSCVRSAMLHASETWAPTLSDLHHLQCNDWAMIRWMCRVTTKDQVSSEDLLERMQLDDLVKYSTPANSDGTAM